MYRLPFVGAGALALAVFVCTATGARADDSAATLLGKARAYMGWQYGDASVRTIVTKLQYTRKDGTPAWTETTSRIGAIFRTDRKGKLLSSSHGFTGTIGWTTDENGFTTPLIGEPAKSSLSWNLFFAGALSALPGTLHGSATVDGKTLPGVLIQQANAFPIIAYIDPDSGAIRRVTVDEGGSYENSLDVLSYKTLDDGKRYPAAYRYEGSRGAFTVQSVHFNGEVGSEQLEPPAQSAQWDYGNAQPFSISVTPSRIIVSATINNVPGHFILDTGADGIFLTRSFAGRAHLAALGRDYAQGIGEMARPEDIVKIDSLRIGSSTLTHVFGEADARDENREVDRLSKVEIDGAIGKSLLAAAIVTVDFGAQTMKIEAPDADLSGIHGVKVGIDLSTGVPRTPMLFNGKIKTLATLDSGSPSDYLMSYGLRRNGLNMVVMANTRFSGVGDYEIGECGRIDEASIGPIHTGQSTACFSNSFQEDHSLVGLAFMRQMDKIVFDYPHSALYLIPPH